MAKNNAITIRKLTKSYDDNRVLQGIDLDIERGTMLALLGPNGAGKTTIVKILSTLVKPDSGDVTINGHNVVLEPTAVKSVIGLTGQSAAIDELLTGRENLVMMGRLYRLTKHSAIARTNELLEEFDLVDAADKKTSTYSGGMRRRLDLAVSIIATPPIIFLDEPTTGLDPRSRLVMWNIIEKLKSKGTTILLTTQYLEEADKLADNIVLIDKGKVAAEGKAADLKSKVGRDRLVLTFKDLATWKNALGTVGDLVLDSMEKSLQMTFNIKGDGTDVNDILDLLRKKHVLISSIDIRKPTLDDVFMSLTDRSKNSKNEGTK